MDLFIIGYTALLNRPKHVPNTIEAHVSLTKIGAPRRCTSLIHLTIWEYSVAPPCPGPASSYSSNDRRWWRASRGTSLLQSLSQKIAHIYYAHFPLVENRWMVTPHWKECWDMWSLARQHLPNDDCTLWKSRPEFGGPVYTLWHTVTCFTLILTWER